MSDSPPSPPPRVLSFSPVPIGVNIFVLGVAVACLVGLVLVARDSGRASGNGPMGVLCLAVLLPFGLLGFYRRSTRIEADSRTVVHWTRWLWVYRETRQDRSEFAGVRLTCGRRGRNGRVLLYRLTLQGRQRDENLRDYPDCPLARQHAAWVAGALGVTFWDESADAPPPDGAPAPPPPPAPAGLLKLDDVLLDGGARQVSAPARGYRFEDVAHVVIAFRRRWLLLTGSESGGWEAATPPGTAAYTLALLTHDGREVPVKQAPSYLMARHQARQLADFLGVGLLDRTLDPPRAVEAGALAESLAARPPQLLEGGHPLRWSVKKVPLPPTDRVSVRRQKDGLVFDLPVPRVRPWQCAASGLLVGFAAACVTALVSGWLGLQPLRPPGLYLVLAVGAAVSVAMWRYFVTSIRAARVWLTVSPRTLELDRHDLTGRKHLAIPVAELEQVEVGAPRLARPFAVSVFVRAVVGACSATHMLEFGHELARPELDWLRDVIVVVITRQQEEAGESREPGAPPAD
jgi:hypothetical protein